MSPIATVILAAVLSLLPSLAATSPPAADPAAGERIYARCIACHSPERNRTGPLHCGLLGRSAGSVPGYDYSNALSEAGIHWTRETLDRFLESPLEMVPGTTMGFAGIADADERRDLIAWLSTLNDTAERCRDTPAH